MSGPETVTQPMACRTPTTTHPILHPPHTHRVMCRRHRYTEHRHSMKDIDQRTRRAGPTLTRQSTPTLIRKNFRRGRLPPCHTAAVRIVDSTQLTVGRDTVTNTRCDKGRLRASRPLARLG